MTRMDSLSRLMSPWTQTPATAEKYAAHLEELFEFVTPEQIGADYAAALENEDYAAAVRLLAGYYQTRPDTRPANLSCAGTYSLEEAERTLNGIARSINRDWTFPKGEVDFLFDPTTIQGPRDYEWLWQFNRHPAWQNLAHAYHAVHDERYAMEFQTQLLRWIEQTYNIPEDYNGHGSAWRTIECGIRLLGSWQIAFDGFRHSPSVGDIPLLLMIASMHRQATHLLSHNRREGWRMGNWMLLEMNGLYTFSALFPELKDSDENRQFAAARIVEELKKQILPDGMQYELSPDYGFVVFNCASNFYELSHALGFTDGAEELTSLLHASTHAQVLLSTPRLTQPCTNDCHTIGTSWFTGRSARILEDRPEYRYINTKRAQGTPPAGDTPSAFLPYAGFAAMRSDWGADAAYLCFDVGPLGMAHEHQDKLNIILYKGEEELLYDDGGGQYEISDARRYGLSAYAHNTALVDGMGQTRIRPACVEEPLDIGWVTNDRFDYATASFEDGFGPAHAQLAVHKREVRFCRPDFFCVEDTLTSADGTAHDYELLFHLDTTTGTRLDDVPNGFLSSFGRQYELLMIPVDDTDADVELNTVSASPAPHFQGWYNGRNETDLHPALTVSRVVRQVQNFRFCTLLFPIQKGEALPSVRQSGRIVEIDFHGRTITLDRDALNR